MCYSFVSFCNGHAVRVVDDNTLVGSIEVGIADAVGRRARTTAH